MRNLIDTLWGEWKTVEQQVEQLNDELERISVADAGAHPQDSGHRTCHCDSHRCGDRQWRCVSEGPRVRRMARHRAAPVFDRWQGEAVRHQQARQSLSAQDPDPWARAAVLRIKREGVSIGAWLERLDARAHKNIVVVAMANKLARIAWAVLSSGNEYRPATVPA